MAAVSSNMLRPRFAHLAHHLVSLAFILTGVGTAMLGAVLPAMLAQWHLSDRSGGSLLFLAFAGSTLGAAITHRPHRLIPAVGLFVCGCGTGLTVAFGAALLRLDFTLYGLGLGLTMTAISLQQSDLVGVSGSLPEMNRLNLLWAVGACCAPPLALHSLQRVSVDLLFRCGTAVLLTLGFTMVLIAGRSEPEIDHRYFPLTSRLPWAPLHLCLFAGAAVALEASLGGWLTTYTERHAVVAGLALSATASFWLGLLLSRLLHSVRLGRVLRNRRGVLLHMTSIISAVLLLVAVPHEPYLLPAAFLAGWGLGPLYPLVLSLALPRYRSGGVFVAAGVGSALLPWLTGAISTRLGSLRAGMFAPALAVWLLIGTGFLMWSEIPEHSRVPA